MWTDSHAHLTLLEHAPLPEILERARLASVDRIITVSTEPSNWDLNRSLASRNPNIYYSLGLHPHQATLWTQSAGDLYHLFQGVPPRCVAIGEIGLDFHYDFCPQEIQIEVFESQLALAKKLSLPIIIHCREAFDTLYGSIRKIGLSERRAVMHCFTGSASDAKTALDLGMMVSFSGIVTFKNASDLRETAKGIPLERLLLETDCPYLAPAPKRGQPNEPALLPLTGAVLAMLRGQSEEDLAQRTTQNAVEFFGIS